MKPFIGKPDGFQNGIVLKDFGVQTAKENAPSPNVGHIFLGCLPNHDQVWATMSDSQYALQKFGAREELSCQRVLGEQAAIKYKHRFSQFCEISVGGNT